jgi:hypothetical protein
MVDAEPFEDGCGDAFGEEPGEQVVGADFRRAVGPGVLTGLVEAGLQPWLGAGGEGWAAGRGGDGETLPGSLFRHAEAGTDVGP